MQIHEVKRNTKQAKSKVVGRGGTRGKTSGRGHKGQKQHGGHGIRPELRDIIKKIPKMRGRGVNMNKSVKAKAQTVNIEALDKVFSSDDTITPKVLLEKNLVRRESGKLPEVKILSTGETKKKFTIFGCSFSKPAKEKLEKAGSSIK